MGDGWAVRRVDQGVRRRGLQDRKRPSNLITKDPDGGPLYVWFGCALVRPGRCDLRRSRHARPGGGGRRRQRLVLTVESGQLEAGCPACGVLAVGHGRRVRMLHDAPCFGRVTLVRWLSADLALPRTAVRDGDVQRDPRSGAAADGVDDPGGALGDRRAQLRRHHRLGAGPPSGRGLAHLPGTRSRSKPRPGSASPTRLKNVKTLGVDEHIWRPSRIGIDRAVTIMVDLTRDQDGCLHARLLDAVVGRSGTVYKAWLTGPTRRVHRRRGARRLGSVPRLRQRDPRRAARRGRGPGRLPRGAARHPGRRRGPPPRPARHPGPPRPQARPALQDPRAPPPRRRTPHRARSRPRSPPASTPATHTDEVNLAWQCYQQLRSIYHAAPAKGREIAIKVFDSFHSCPIPEVARLGRTLRAWRPKCWPTSTPQGSPTAAPKPST